jgi:retron-type reverse transcriptase
VNWILDADIKGFFDHVSHEWLEKFLKHRIADTRVLRLIQKWMKAGVLEDGERLETEQGTPDQRRSSMVSLVQDKIDISSAPVARR